MLPHRNAALLCHRLNRRVQSDKEKPPKTVHVRGKGAPLEQWRAQLRRHCQHALESAWPLRARLPDRGTGLAIQGHVKVSQNGLPRADTRVGARGTEALLHEDVLGPDVAVDYSRTVHMFNGAQDVVDCSMHVGVHGCRAQPCLHVTLIQRKLDVGYGRFLHQEETHRDDIRVVESGQDRQLLPQCLQTLLPVQIVFLERHVGAVKGGTIHVMSRVGGARERLDVGIVAEFAIRGKECRHLRLVCEELGKIRRLIALLHENGQLWKV
mmetsp:Transcript_65324/g.105842  ORF Transcript_65324/g.105842 Transcript_65324/m.105842 type:complete len:267 (-) Transcript_65324:132-932(-)